MLVLPGEISTGVPDASNDPAPDGTAAHPADAGSLRDQLVARGNLAEALRRVEQNAGAPGNRRDEHQGAAAVVVRPLAAGSLAARGGHLPAATRSQGDDPQALGWIAQAGGADGHVLPRGRPRAFGFVGGHASRFIRCSGSGLRFFTFAGARTVGGSCATAAASAGCRCRRRRLIAVRSRLIGR